MCALQAQTGMDTRSPIGSPTLLMNALDAVLKDSISPGSRRGLAGAPGIVATPRNAQNSAHHSNTEDGLVRRYEFEDSGGSKELSRAKEAAAFFKISFS